MSSYFKGLLAHILETTIPSGRRIHLCHACHNSDCSNPNHLYWGTPGENRADAIANGACPGPNEAMLAKYGSEGMALVKSRAAKLNQNGKGNRGKSKSPEHKAKIAEAIKNKHLNGEYDEVDLGRKKEVATLGSLLYK